MSGSPKKLSPQMERVSLDLRHERSQQAARLTIESDNPQPSESFRHETTDRRRALSGVESPRAPHPGYEWCLADPDDISPLGPLEDMLEEPQQHVAPVPKRHRRRAMSSPDSPRAPQNAFQSQTVPKSGEEWDHPDSPIAPLGDMLDSPRTSERFVNQAAQRANTSELTVNTGSSSSYTSDNSPEEQQPRRRKALSGMDSPRAPGRSSSEHDLNFSSMGDISDILQNPEYLCQAEPRLSVEQAESVRPVRRLALSGMNSPRAPSYRATAPIEALLPDLKPLDDMLDTPRTSARHIAQADHLQRRPAALHVTNSAALPIANRRKALSNCDSPRAPRISLDLQQEDLDNLTELTPPHTPYSNFNSPLPPVNEMLDSPHTQANFVTQAAGFVALQRPEAGRRQALSGPDSPRAPNTKPVQPNGWTRVPVQPPHSPESPPQSPLPPLNDMLDSPRTQMDWSKLFEPRGISESSSEEAQVISDDDPSTGVGFIEQRLAEAEEANSQWSEYCIQLQHQNSILLGQVSNLQKQNSELQRRVCPRTHDPRVEEYQAALYAEYSPASLSPRIASPVGPVGLSFTEQEVFNNRRNALSGRDSPRAPPDVGEGLSRNTSFDISSHHIPTLWHSPSSPFDALGGYQRGLPEAALNASMNGHAEEETRQNGTPDRSCSDSRSPARAVCASPLLQRLLNSSPGRPGPPSFNSTQRANNGRTENVSNGAQDQAMERLTDALESYMAQDPGILNKLQERLHRRGSRS